MCDSFLLFRRSANSSKTVEYFKPLGRARMDRLFSIYQIDFEMFGYSYEIYAGSWSAWSSNLMLLHILVYTFICPVQFVKWPLILRYDLSSLQAVCFLCPLVVQTGIKQWKGLESDRYWNCETCIQKPHMSIDVFILSTYMRKQNW